MNLGNWGLLFGTSAIVFPSTAPNLILYAARLAKYIFGERIQICTGTNDEVKIEAADAIVGTGGEVRLLAGTYYIQSDCDLDGRSTVRGVGQGTVLALAANADSIILTGSGAAGTNQETCNRLHDVLIDTPAGYTGEACIVAPTGFMQAPDILKNVTCVCDVHGGLDQTGKGFVLRVHESAIELSSFRGLRWYGFE